MGEYPARHEQHRINDDDFAAGWRESLEQAIDAALVGYRDGDEAEIDTIRVKKRGDSSFHDHKVKLKT